MNKTVTKCEHCSHESICALKQEFKETESKLPEMIDNFGVTLTCLNFSSNLIIRKPF